jgi:hypothetical protein
MPFDDDPVTAVAGYGIPGSVTTLPLEPLRGESWSQLVAGVRRHGLVALLGAAVSDDAVPVTEQQSAAVDVLVSRASSATRLHEQVLVETVDSLSAAGIETRVVGGAAVRRLDYRKPALRSVDDIELLVRPDRHERAVTCLTSRGYRVPVAPAASTSAGSRTRLTSPGGADVTLTDRPGWLRGDPAGLWGRSESFEVAGRALCALGREERLVASCAASAGADAGDEDEPLGPRRDIAEATLHVGLDTERLLRLADDWAVTRVVAAGIRSTWTDLRLADVVALSIWAQSWHDRSGGSGSAGAGAFGRLARALTMRPGGQRR